MQRYSNHSGNSGVSGYEIGADYIDIQFEEETVYRYSYTIPGSSYVEQMKRLALEGKGLSSFISRYVRENYVARLKLYTKPFLEVPLN